MPEDPLTRKIIGLAIEVHRQLGPGLLESAYRDCLCHEFQLHNIAYEKEKVLPLHYKGIDILNGYRVDIMVENKVILELKTVENILPIHKAQLITYLKLSGIETGLLINFHVTLLRDGIERLSKDLPLNNI
jgi:GxxExxY protein